VIAAVLPLNVLMLKPGFALPDQVSMIRDPNPVNPGDLVVNTAAHGLAPRCSLASPFERMRRQYERDTSWRSAIQG
jgi:hypothetical protein